MFGELLPNEGETLPHSPPPSLEDFRQIAKIQLNCQNFAAVDSLPET